MTTWLFAAAALAALALRWALAKRQIDATPLLFALAPVNVATFSLRRALAWSRGPVQHRNEPKGELFAFAGDDAGELSAREHELRSRYRLAPLRASSSMHAYRENLYVLDILDRHAGVAKPLPSPVRALDVGSQDFRYAFGLSRWLGGRRTALTGIEIDGHQIYADLHSRKEHAEAFVRAIDESRVDYQVGDFLVHEERGVDVVTFFFPFVLEYALVRWGLPRKCFQPRRIFRHAWDLLRPGGVVLIMNHTEAERKRQVEILAECGFEVIQSGPVESKLVDYAADVPERSLTVARRPAKGES